MEEPTRLNLLNVLHKSLKAAEKKTYLHRIIYIGNYETKTAQDSKLLQILFESGVKLINEAGDEPITGFSLFYSGYFISIIEGTEDMINKHLKILLDSFDTNKSIPSIDKMKLLFVSHHIIKRYYTSYYGRPARPPVLLEKIEPTSNAEDNKRHINTCILKMYRLSEFLRNQPPNLLRAAIDNISELCLAHLPEFILLDFLLQSPALIDLRDYVRLYGSVPDVKPYQEMIWPAPDDFVPYDIIGEDRSKKLMFTPEELQTENKYDEQNSST